MHSIVIAREIWDTRDLDRKNLDEGGRVRADALATRFEPEDLNALEMALQIKDKHGGKVTVLSLGAPRGVDVLKECLYRGVDAVVRVELPAGDELDTQAEAELYAAAIGKIGAFDLVLTGVTVGDGRGSLAGAHLAARLDVELITWMDALGEVGPERVVGRRAIEMGYEHIEVKLPAVLLVGVALLKDDPRSPRTAKAALKLKHKKTEVASWTAESLGVADLGARRTTVVAARELIAERAIESKSVDGADEAALGAMLAAIQKGN